MSASAVAATVGTFTGADPGEGLDLQGNFTYAINFGTTGGAGKAGDANFTSDVTPGMTYTAPNEVTAWLTANYGDTAADNALEKVMGDIRWAAAPDTVKVSLSVEQGAKYKLQLLFAESCCRNRAFDVKLDGQLIPEGDEFNPAVTQGDDLATVGAVITQEFTAASAVYEIELDGPGVENPEYTDHNAILNGLTLERLSAVGDEDGDGMRDDWEKRFFGDLNQKPTDDPDGDGLTNAEELAAETLPTSKDTDNDGLNDGPEVKTYKSDPAKADTDADSIADGREVNDLKTDPTKFDSDGDGASDPGELVVGTNPADAKSISKRVVVASFTGADAGEGLDFQGNFIHALNIGGSDAPTVGQATFSPMTDADSATGVTVEAGNQVTAWHVPAYGESGDDDGLEQVMQSIRWSNAASAEVPAVRITFDNLEVGADYKLQLLVAEQCCAGRGYDVLQDGALIANDFNPPTFQRGAGNTATGAVVSISFIARNTTTVFSLDGRSVTTLAFNDHNAILNALTLEKLSARTDTDNDGLSDVWEQDVLGGLSQGAADDTDADGIKNSDEFTGNTLPAVADSDNDGLSDGEEKTAGTGALNPDTDGDGLPDGAEVKTYKSNPLVTDTDEDRLSDGDEVNRYKSDPTKKDTDGDTFADLIEALSGSDPASAASTPKFTLVSPFTGGDAGEGLDLDGKFIYALNIGGPDGATARDASFVPASAADTVEGVEITTQNEIQAWHQPSYGDSANDDAIETILLSIRWSAAPAKPTIKLSQLVAGRAYKLQLLFAESCCSRGFDVVVNGKTIANDFAPFIAQGGINNQAAGAVVAHSFKAAADTVEIVLDGPAAPYGDRNATISGLTLEDLGPAGPEFNEVVPIQFAAPAIAAGNLTLSWTGGGAGPFTLERKASLADATWTPVAQLTVRSATIPADAATGFFRIRE